MIVVHFASGSAEVRVMALPEAGMAQSVAIHTLWIVSRLILRGALHSWAPTAP